jgi:hypothetical protein
MNWSRSIKSYKTSIWLYTTLINRQSQLNATIFTNPTHTSLVKFKPWSQRLAHWHLPNIRQCQSIHLRKIICKLHCSLTLKMISNKSGKTLTAFSLNSMSITTRSFIAFKCMKIIMIHQNKQRNWILIFNSKSMKKSVSKWKFLMRNSKTKLRYSRPVLSIDSSSSRKQLLRLFKQWTIHLSGPIITILNLKTSRTIRFHVFKWLKNFQSLKMKVIKQIY